MYIINHWVTLRKWQEHFLYENFVVTGNVGAINIIDAQITWRIPAAKSTFIFGGWN
jgi:iron complex outermembrane recepter protein